MRDGSEVRERERVSEEGAMLGEGRDGVTHQLISLPSPSSQMLVILAIK